MPRNVLITTLALSALAAVLGYQLGQSHARADLSGIVNAVAQEHANKHAGDAQSCIGWIVDGEEMPRVTCGKVTYRIDRYGRAIVMEEPGA